MKKTLSINLNGVAFYIDEDAYSTLKSYLNDLSKHFSDAEESEILKDIDARIAELFTERLNNGNKTVVEMQDVEAVIETLGSPNQFDVDGDEKEPQSKADEKKKTQYRKLYRNPNDVIWVELPAMRRLFRLGHNFDAYSFCTHCYVDLGGLFLSIF